MDATKPRSRAALAIEPPIRPTPIRHKRLNTLYHLGQRIDERFPAASLGNVCRELLQIARETHERVNWSARSLPWIRVGVCAVILAAIAAVWFAVRYIKLQGQPELEELDAGFNVMILFGASLFFLLSLAGIPPLAGFWGKFFVFSAAIDGNAMGTIDQRVACVVGSCAHLIPKPPEPAPAVAETKPS